MSTAAMIDLLFIAVVLAAVLFWIFVAPARARKKRHAEMFGETGHFRSWDPDIGARKRER